MATQIRDTDSFEDGNSKAGEATCYICKSAAVHIGGSKGGGRQGRAPPGGPNSFIFMQFSAKIINKHTHFGSWRPSPPLGKILDPPLVACPQHLRAASRMHTPCCAVAKHVVFLPAHNFTPLSIFLNFLVELVC